MCVGVKNHIVTFEKCMIWCEKGYKWIGELGNPKTKSFKEINWLISKGMSYLLK